MKLIYPIMLALLCGLNANPAQAKAVDPQSPAVSEQSQWELIWSDEFNGQSIDMDKWSFETNCWGGGNEERQCYTDREVNARLNGGNLEIIARRERYKGHALPRSQWKSKKDAKKSAIKPYTAARLRTLGKGDWRYGRFEIRAKLPGGQGVWPAIWMLPTDNHYGTWASSGEIDIMEAVNLGVDCDTCTGGRENHVLGTLHFGGQWPDNKFKGNETEIENPISEFHTYAIEWSAGKISWFVDDRQFATQTFEDWHSEGEEAKGRPLAPFDQRFHLLLNMAIGGGLPEARNGGGVSKKGYPKTMLVDWVRVYQCKADPNNGLACQ